MADRRHRSTRVNPPLLESGGGSIGDGSERLNRANLGDKVVQKHTGRDDTTGKVMQTRLNSRIVWKLAFAQ